MSGILSDRSGGPPITIRAGTPADAEAIHTLHRRSILMLGRDFYSKAELQSWAHGLRPGGYVRAMTERGERYLLAIDEAGAVIGFCSYKDDEIMGFYVDPSRARSGVGRIMLGHAERALAAGGYGTFRVRASLSGRPFYGAHGYRAVAERPWKTKAGLEITVFDMEKTIGAPDGRPGDAGT